MGAVIDRLEVQVEAQATKANNQLDKLVGKLNSLSNSLSHINSSGLAGLSNGVAKFAQASSQLSNVKTADFTRLTKNIHSLSSLNTQRIYGAASAMRTLSTAINSIGGVSASSMQVAQVAKDISKLGGANVQKAISNLPLLATAMNNLMATLSKAPSVNRNIIDMTNALANLASQGNRVGSASNSLVNGLNRTSSAMARTRRSSISLAAAFDKFYASWWLLIRISRKFWDSIENSMNYVEILNYFDAAFGQVADSAVSQWEDAGYSSADAYYKSFSDRAKELTSKMTGFSINDDGTLTATGNASLGINPTKLMNYQATFAQMSSSIGVTAETSLLLSQALTEIGADLASVKNMDFDKVWKDMASGLAGMSRTLDKYGVNIRNVNLQQKLFDLGINENITNLNQNDKALLRAIILLDSTRYAWGDLADTLNQPANQMRLLDSNLNNFSRTIGNLFLPAVSNLLPYANGLVIALQRLFTWAGNLLGISIKDIIPENGESEVDIGELIGETDDLTDSFKEASKAADKLKRGIRGFDELNVITTQNDSDSSLSGSGLQSGLLDDAFADIFSEYQKVWDEAFANMENRANEFADNVEEFLQPVRDIIADFAIGDFLKAGKDTSNLVTGIYNFFSDAIDNVDWDKVGDKIGGFIYGMDWMKVITSAFRLKFNIWKAIAEAWFSSFNTAPIETSVITALAAVKFTGLGSMLGPKIASAIFGSSLVSHMTAAWISIGGISGILTTDLATILGAGTLTEIGLAIGTGIIGGIASAFLGFNIGKELGKRLFLEDAQYYDNFHWFGKDGFFDIVSDDWAVSLNAASEMSKAIQNNAIYKLITGAINTPKVKPFSQLREEFIELKNEFDEDWNGVENWFNKNILPWTTKEKWLMLGDNIKGGLSDKWTEFTNWWENTGFYEWWKNVGEYFNKKSWTWDGIKEGLSESWNAAVYLIKNIWNTFANWLNDKLTWEIDPISIAGKEIFGGASINLGKIPTFALGGFPEDGWFRASKGEYFGQFDDGTSYIANNNQIVDGVAAGVEEAAYRGMMRALSESGGVTVHIEGDSSGMYKVWKEEYRREAARLQKNPVPIF